MAEHTPAVGSLQGETLERISMPPTCGFPSSYCSSHRPADPSVFGLPSGGVRTFAARNAVSVPDFAFLPTLFDPPLRDQGAERPRGPRCTSVSPALFGILDSEVNACGAGAPQVGEGDRENSVEQMLPGSPNALGTTSACASPSKRRDRVRAACAGGVVLYACCFGLLLGVAVMTAIFVPLLVSAESPIVISRGGRPDVGPFELVARSATCGRSCSPTWWCPSGAVCMCEACNLAAVEPQPGILTTEWPGSDYVRVSVYAPAGWSEEVRKNVPCEYEFFGLAARKGGYHPEIHTTSSQEEDDLEAQLARGDEEPTASCLWSSVFRQWRGSASQRIASVLQDVPEATPAALNASVEEEEERPKRPGRKPRNITGWWPSPSRPSTSVAASANTSEGSGGRTPGFHSNGSGGLQVDQLVAAGATAQAARAAFVQVTVGPHKACGGVVLSATAVLTAGECCTRPMTASPSCPVSVTVPDGRGYVSVDSQGGGSCDAPPTSRSTRCAVGVDVDARVFGWAGGRSGGDMGADGGLGRGVGPPLCVLRLAAPLPINATGVALHRGGSIAKGESVFVVSLGDTKDVDVLTGSVVIETMTVVENYGRTILVSGRAGAPLCRRSSGSAVLSSVGGDLVAVGLATSSSSRDCARYAMAGNSEGERVHHARAAGFSTFEAAGWAVAAATIDDDCRVGG